MANLARATDSCAKMANMGQTLANILVHVTFSTYQRTPNLTPEIRDELHPYLASIVKAEGSFPIQVGGAADHIHLLIALGREQALSKTVGAAKASSSKWLKSMSPILREFAWQSGYAAFSVSPSARETVARYIANQEEHHRKRCFEEELIDLLRSAGFDYDERYLWT